MFDIKGDKILLNTDDLAIPAFKDYYNSAKDKSQALKMMEFIIWRYKWNTPYEAYPEKERTDRVAKDVFKVDNFVPDAETKELIKRFNEFQETTGTRLLGASKTAAEGLIDALNVYSKDAMDIDTALKITRILKDVGNIVKSIDTAERQARVELVESGKVKGGGQIGLYETVNM